MGKASHLVDELVVGHRHQQRSIDAAILIVRNAQIDPGGWVISLGIPDVPYLSASDGDVIGGKDQIFGICKLYGLTRD